MHEKQSEYLSSLINEIKFLRLGLLPPYSSNGDEDEMDIGDYLAFYNTNIEDSIKDTQNYLAALAKFADDKENIRTVDLLIDARRKYILTFPFSSDELNQQDVDNGIMEYMLKIYQHETSNGFLVRNIEHYLNVLNQIKAELR